jgi:hypothetical protein
MKEFITKIKMFTPDNYDKEEQYLRDMSLRGWHLLFLKGIVYTFEKGEPTSYCYRLDFMPDVDIDKESYLKLYEDCGWNHIFEFRPPVAMGRNVWQYFRIESATGNEEVLFSDNDSKIDMLKRVRRFFTWLTAFMLLMFTPNIFFFNIWLKYDVGYVIALVLPMWACIFALYISVNVRLNRKIKKLEDEKIVRNS